MAYATLADLFVHGLPPEVLVPSSRVVSAVDPATDRITLPGHGLSDNDVVQVEVQGGALPGGLSASTVYYARTVDGSESLFGLSLTSGGALVDITDAGSGAISIIASVSAKVDAILRATADEIDEALVAHAVPLPSPYPPIVVQWNAKLAAFGVMTALGRANERWDKSLQPLQDEATRIRQVELARYRKGIPLRSLVADSTPDVAENGAVSWAEPDRGWSNLGSDGSPRL